MGGTTDQLDRKSLNVVLAGHASRLPGFSCYRKQNRGELGTMTALRSKEQFQPGLATPSLEKGRIQPDLATHRSEERIQPPDVATPHSEERIQPDLAAPEERIILATPDEQILATPDERTPDERILATPRSEEGIQPDLAPAHSEEGIQPDLATAHTEEQTQPDLATPRSEEGIQPDLATAHSEEGIQPDLATAHTEEQTQPDLATPEERIQPDLAALEERIQPDLAIPDERIQPDLATLWLEEQIQPDFATPCSEEKIQPDFTTPWSEKQIQPDFATPWSEEQIQTDFATPWSEEQIQTDFATPWSEEQIQTDFATPWSEKQIQSDFATPWLEEQIPCRLTSPSLDEEQSQLPLGHFQPDFFVRCLEDMLPFVEPDDVQTLALLAVKKNIVSLHVKEDIEALHESVTHQQKFRYLMWNMYKFQRGLFIPRYFDIMPFKFAIRHSSSVKKFARSKIHPDTVETFLRILATLPFGKSLARDYKSKSAPSIITKIANKIKKKNSTYDWLVKRFSEHKFVSENQPVSDYKYAKINLVEKKDFFKFLLEGCAGPIQAYCKYEWHKNGAVLNKESPLLCLNVADITVEGEYTMTRNDELMASITICLNTLMDNFRQCLTQKYLETVTNVDKDEWPKVKQNTYINLAVIKSDKSENLNSFVCQTIRGDADDVHGEKGEVDYKSTFENIQHGERVIVQGRPGSGKTTLVHKISQDWSNEAIKWRHIRALFLIHLRRFRSRPSINLRDFLLCYFTSEETLKSINEYIISKDGLGICFILDGLDEYQPDDKTESIVFKLIEKEVLSKAIVIVASRPAAVATYRSLGKNIEVLGFFKDQVLDYIDSYDFCRESSSSMLKEYLTNRPNIYHMCYLPIQLAMICFLYDHFEEKGNKFPDTETEVYEQFARHMLLRTFYRQRSKEKFYLKNIFSLPKVEEKLLKSICTLAFEKTLSSLQVLEQADVDLFCEEIDTNSCLGLLTVDQQATLCGFQNMYTFCHLTFQEFLAACHVYLASDVHQSELIKICKQKDHMTVVLKFFCGLEDFQIDSGAKFGTVINSPHLNSLARIQCSYESKQPITCQYVIKNNTLNIIENFLTTRDWSSIGYVIKNASCNPVKILQLNYSVITEEGTKALTNLIKNHDLITIQKLNILGSFNRLPLFFVNCLHQLQVICGSLNVSVTKLRALHSDLQHSELKVIQFYDNDIPKLSIKFDVAPLKYLLSLSSSLIERETTSLDFVSLSFQIIKKSLTSADPLLAGELNCQLYNICKSSKCIKLSGIVKNGSRQNIMIVNSSQKVVDVISTQTQMKNCSALFSDYTLEYTDTIPFGNYLIVVIVLTTTTNTYFNLYILPSRCVNKVSLKCMDKIVESLELGVAYSLNKYPRSLYIMNHKQNIDIEVQQLFDRTLEQLEIKCDDANYCSYLTESLDKCPELKSFSFHASKTMFIPAMRNIFKSLSLKKIEVLELINFDLEDVMSVSLVPSLRAWKYLRELCLKNCSITGKSVTSLVQAITGCTQLTALDLSSNDIGDEGCQALAVSMLHEFSKICSFPLLRRLNLSNCNIKDAGVSFLASMLKNYSSLKFLGMAKTTFKNVSLEELFLAFQNSKNLSEMELSHTTLESFSAFSSQMPKSLRILRLCACKAQDFSLAPLMNNKLLMSSLCVLDMSGNNWPVIDLIQIFDVTKVLQELSLSCLSLSQNDSGDLTEGLMKLRNLNVLRFNYFNIKAVDYSFIQFITNTSITSLELCHLVCGYNVYEEICRRIKDAKSLQSLDLSHNVAINNVSQILSRSIKQCLKLNILRLCDCGIRKNEAEELAAAILACESIRSIDMSQNDFGGVHNEFISSKFIYCDHLITFHI